MSSEFQKQTSTQQNSLYTVCVLYIKIECFKIVAHLMEILHKATVEVYIFRFRLIQSHVGQSCRKFLPAFFKIISYVRENACAGHVSCVGISRIKPLKQIAAAVLLLPP